MDTEVEVVIRAYGTATTYRAVVPAAAGVDPAVALAKSVELGLALLGAVFNVRAGEVGNELDAGQVQ